MIRVHLQDQVTVIGFSGAFDSLNNAVMQATERSVLEVVAAAATPAVVFDLSGTRYAGSAFLQMLVRAWHRLGGRNGAMALCGVQEFCRKVLSASGLDRLWGIYRSPDEAVRALRQV